MELIELTTDTLNDIIQENETVMVQYGATWCGNCRLVKPKFKRLAGEHTDIKFYYVDAEKLPGSRQLADVKNLPTFAAFKGGQLISQASGNKIEIVNELIDAITPN